MLRDLAELLQSPSIRLEYIGKVVKWLVVDESKK